MTASVLPSAPSSRILGLRSGSRWDARIPPAVQPLVRAYLLGYASAVAPRLLTLLLQHLTRWKHAKRQQQMQQQNGDTFLESLERILRSGFDPRRFPTFCAALVGGSTLLEVCAPDPFQQLPLSSEREIRSTDATSRAP